MQKDGLINNTSKMCDSTFHEWCDQTVRILFSKYRELKKDPAARARISKRCTSKQNSAIDAVLAVIKVAEITEDKQTKSAVTLSPPKSWGSWQTMVASGSITNNPASCATPTSSNKAAATPTQPTAEDYGLPPCCNIFRTILQQDEPQQETLQQPKTSIAAAPAILGSPNPSKSKRHNASWKMAERTPPDAKAAVASPCADVDISDDKIFQKTMSQAKAAANAKGSGIKPKAKAAPQTKKTPNPVPRAPQKVPLQSMLGHTNSKKLLPEHITKLSLQLSDQVVTMLLLRQVPGKLTKRQWMIGRHLTRECHFVLLHKRIAVGGKIVLFCMCQMCS